MEIPATLRVKPYWVGHRIRSNEDALSQGLMCSRNLGSSVVFNTRPVSPDRVDFAPQPERRLYMAVLFLEARSSYRKT
jgi:hypothetical protein